MRYTFTLLIAIYLFCYTSGQKPPVWINEFHYDNSGADKDEGIELAGPAGSNISGYRLSFYNGKDSLVYKTYTIPDSTIILDDGSGLGTKWFDISGLQNGPDALALSGNNGELIQFISYEGSFIARNGPANGIISQDILVSEGPSTKQGYSIQLTGKGMSYSDFEWKSNLLATPGKSNSEQQFGLIVDTLAPEFSFNFPKLDSVSSDLAVFSLKLNEPSKVYFKIQPEKEVPPTIDDVISSDSYFYSDTSLVKLVTVKQLLGATDYAAYIIASDTAAMPNYQDSIRIVTFKTALYQNLTILQPEVPDSSFIGDSLAVVWESENIEKIMMSILSEKDGVWFILKDSLQLDAKNDYKFYLSPDLVSDSIKFVLRDYENSLIADTSFTVFIIDTLSPVIKSLLPLNKSNNIRPLDTFHITFNEKIQLLRAGRISLFCKSDSSLIQSLFKEKLSVRGNTISFCLDSLLKGGVEYFFQINDDFIADLKGNPFRGVTSDTMWAFSTLRAGVYFSEYTEGSGYNKAIELFNPTDAVIDLSEYTIKRSFNGEGWIDSIIIEELLEPDCTYVIAHSGADSGIISKADLQSVFVRHNGNDAFGLFRGDSLMDIIGRPAENPGKGWAVAGVEEATKDYTLLRKREVISGNNWTGSSGVNSSNSEWIVFPKDFYNNLGKATYVADTNTTPIFLRIPGFSIDSTFRIFPDHDSISLTVIKSARLDSLFLQFIIPAGASIIPSAREVSNFAEGCVNFTIIAEDKLTSRVWKVGLEQMEYPLTGHNIIDVSFNGLIGDPIIDTSEHLVTTKIAYNTSFEESIFQFNLSLGAIHNHLNTNISYRDTLLVEVIAEDGSRTIWHIVFQREEPEKYSISDIRTNVSDEGISKFAGMLVKIQGIVTGKDDHGFYLQDSDSLWSAIYICTDSPIMSGDSTIVVGLVDELVSLTRISTVYGIEVISSNMDLPVPFVSTINEIKQEAFNNLFVCIEQVKCLSLDSKSGIAEVSDGVDSLQIYIDTPENVLEPGHYYTLTGIKYSEIGFPALILQASCHIFDSLTVKPSSDATLRSIKIDGVKLEGFNPLVLNYSYVLDAGKETIPGLSFELSDSNAVGRLISCNLNDEQDNKCIAIIQVLAEDGHTTLEYSVVFESNSTDILEAIDRIEIYPNPVKDILHIAGLNNPFGMIIFDLEGCILLSADDTQLVSRNIDLSWIEPGVYFIRLNFRDQQMFYQFIKE